MRIRQTLGENVHMDGVQRCPFVSQHLGTQDAALSHLFLNKEVGRSRSVHNPFVLLVLSSKMVSCGPTYFGNSNK